MSPFNHRIETNNTIHTEDGVYIYPATGISILIVGAGVGGLVTALECHRKGHNVRILERSAAASAGGRC